MHGVTMKTNMLLMVFEVMLYFDNLLDIVGIKLVFEDANVFRH